MKLKTININGHEVPEPIRKELKKGQAYYVAVIAHGRLCEEYIWSGDAYDKSNLSRGLIHLSKGNVIIHAKALLSFTETEGRFDKGQV